MRYLLSITLIAVGFCVAVAQGTVTEKRIEFESDEYFSSDGVVSFGEAGLVVRSRDNDKTDGGYRWHFRRYDTDLNLREEQTIQLNKRLSLDESYISDDRIYSFFKDYKRGKFLLTDVNADDFTINKLTGELPKKAYTGSMVALGDRVFIDASIKKEPFVLTVDVVNGRQHLVPIQVRGYKPKHIRITNIQTVEESREVFVFVRLIDGRKSSETFIVRLDENGERIGESVLTRSIEENIVDISANYISPGRYSYSGTYSTKKTSLSEGLFYCQVKDDKPEFFETYNFLDLEDFLSYLKERKQKKITRKKARKKKAGKELKINYRMASHNTIPTDDGYLFLGEAYYPTFRQVSYTTYTVVNGVSTPRTSYQSVFDGYRYTHAVVCKFDFQGKMVWDHSFEMWPASKPFYEKRFISLVESEDAVLKMIFASNGSIYTKALSDDGVVLQDDKGQVIETGSENDKVRRSWSDLDYWYDNHFYAFGWQKIKNKEDDDVKRKRKVYFVNKVSF